MSAEKLDDHRNDHMRISWYGNTIENYLLQIYASDHDQLQEALNIVHKTLVALRKLGIEEGTPCDSPGWIRCWDGWCYPGKCPSRITGVK